MTQPKLVSLKEANLVGLTGGKASSLAHLLKNGFNVPNGFVITTPAFNKLDAALEKSILESFDELGVRKVAVRSSAVAEDGSMAAWAGQMDTFLDVDRTGLIESVKKCWKSAGSERAKAYAKQVGASTGPVAVIVQEMVPSDVAGVAFSVHPVTQDRGRMVIEAVMGLGEQLVSGTVTPDTYVVDKQDLEAIETSLAGREPTLGKLALMDIAKQVIKIEELYGFPVDVEWAIASNQLYILQSRPITTLG